MKYISKIILTLWIVCGLAAGNVYSFSQSYGARNFANLNPQFKKQTPSSKGIYSECQSKHAAALIECENELEDDNEKFIPEPFTFSNKTFRQNTYLVHYRYSEFETRSNSLNILYCVFRI